VSPDSPEQLTHIHWNVPGQYDQQYVYSATNNNGQIAQAVQGTSTTSATVTYAYDGLKRATSAITSATAGFPGTYSPVYSDQFGYL